MAPEGRTRSIAPVTVLVALLLVAAAALRGHVPGAEPTPREPPAGNNPLAMAVVVVLLVVAVAVVAVAVIARLRNPSAPPPRTEGRSDWFRTERGRPTWRIPLIAFGVIMAWLLISMLLGRLGGTGEAPAIDGESPAEATESTPAADEPGALIPAADADWSLLGYFYGATVVFLFIIVAGTIITASRRQRRPWRQGVPWSEEDAAEPDARSESLARAAEVALAEVGDLSREPRKAIIACYAAMERELALLPDAAPREFDTASEVLARAVDNRALRPDSATQLVDLFDEARFSPHVMNEGHRDAAVAVLTQVLDELRSHA